MEDVTFDYAIYNFKENPTMESAILLMKTGMEYHSDDMISGATLRERVVKPVQEYLEKHFPS